MNILSFINKNKNIFNLEPLEVERGRIYYHGMFLGMTSEEATPKKIAELEKQDSEILQQMGFSI